VRRMNTPSVLDCSVVGRVMLAVFGLTLGATLSAKAGETWRSTLYPEDWSPGMTDAQGRFLHDFSYAGYHRGEVPIPDVGGPVRDVTKAPYLADATGVKDATAAIQAALDAATQAGGGVVYLPAGTYRVAPPAGATSALRVEGSHVVLRGAGADKTRIFNDAVEMRNKRVIEVRPANAPWWFFEPGRESMTALSEDVSKPTLRLPVVQSSIFHVGDRVIVRIDPTPRFIEEAGMTGKWVVDEKTPKAKRNNLTLVYVRRVVAVEPGILVLDVPTRLPLRTADNARVQKLGGANLAETGLEDFSIGMKQHPATDWSAEEGYAVAGTGPYDVHQSYAIAFDGTENCWMRRVHTYAPPGNAANIHLLSNGVLLGRGRLLTVIDCEFRFPQYRGGGGNGYLYALHGNEGLIRDCVAEGGRHNYDFGLMSASGNVIYHCVAKDGRLFSDFHMFLSAANLIDNVTCDGDSFEANFRPYGGTPMHGMTTTQSVFWNLNGLRYSTATVAWENSSFTRKQTLVLTKGLKDNYIIGTRGPSAKVSADAGAFVEGAGRGDDLQPQSLYRDQLERRLRR
jgi:hypothetical protein